MTIIGYSLNDTIIVFDRIREDVRVHKKWSFRDVVNHALNVTLRKDADDFRDDASRADCACHPWGTIDFCFLTRHDDRGVCRNIILALHCKSCYALFSRS